MIQQPPNLIRRINFLLRFAFFASGITTVLIGQVLPILARHLEINDRQAGDFFIFQFAGSLLGTTICNWFGRRNKFIPATILGCLLMGGGILFLNANSFELCLLGFFLNGTGIGLTLPSINMLTLELNPSGSASVLNILNFFWGIGAILSQPFIDYFKRDTSIFISTLILATTLLVITAVLFLLPRNIEQKRATIEESSKDLSVPPIWTNPIAWMIAAFNFIHVGFESGMGGWLKAYTERVEYGTAVNLFPPILLYFLFFVVGRGIAPIFLRFLDENKLLSVNLLIILTGMGLCVFAKDVWLLSLGASIAGFGTSSVFPTNISRFTKTFGATATRRATPLFLFGTLGSAFTTWLIGYTSNYFGNLRSGMFILLASSGLLIILQTVLMFQTIKRAKL